MVIRNPVELPSGLTWNIHKLDLKREGDKELAVIKAAFNIDALSYQIRFSKLHERRANVIEELYHKIISLKTQGGRISGTVFMYKRNMMNSDEFTNDIKKIIDGLIDMYTDLNSFVEKTKSIFQKISLKI